MDETKINELLRDLFFEDVYSKFLVIKNMLDDAVESVEKLYNSASYIYFKEKLPELIGIFQKVEENVGGNPEVLKDWLRATKDLSYSSPVEYANEIAEAFEIVMEKNGADIACTLYNTLEVIIDSEIVNAADYLQSGGSVSDVAVLAKHGLFSPIEYNNLNQQEKQTIITYAYETSNIDLDLSDLLKEAEEYQNIRNLQM